MGRNPRCEDTFGNYFGAMRGLEGHAAGFPTKRVREWPRRRLKSNHVGGHVIRLDHILSVLAGGIAPTAGLDADFMVVLVCAGVVKCEHAKGSRRVQV